MAKYREIRNRIQGIENTSKITQAMKMVSAAKLRRAQDSIIAARPYGQKLRELLQFLASSMEVAVSPLLEERAVSRVALVVVTADRGLCGAFNSNLLKAATYLIRNKYAAYNAAGNLDIICVGKRAVDYFSRRRGYKVVSTYAGIFDKLDYSIAQQLVAELSAGFLGGQYDHVDVIYNEFKSVIKQTVAVEQFLPIPKLTAEQSHGGTVDYIFEPSPAELLSSLLPNHLNTQMWNVLLESNAAEQGARMTAMENATKNAKDLARSLKLIYNNARQAAITTEILEIVSGAEALRKQ
jgi:F-type H+-transporting ATPase subunit gamma